MPGIYVCPFCDSRKISKEEGDAQYCCVDCLEFFDEPKEVFTEENQHHAGGKETMRDKIDQEVLKELFAEGKSDKEMAVVFDCLPSAVWAMRKKLGLKRAEKSPAVKKAAVPKQQPPEREIPTKLSDVTAIDLLAGERDQLLAKVGKINQAIEILQG